MVADCQNDKIMWNHGDSILSLKLYLFYKSEFTNNKEESQENPRHCKTIDFSSTRIAFLAKQLMRRLLKAYWNNVMSFCMEFEKTNEGKTM